MKKLFIQATILIIIIAIFSGSFAFVSPFNVRASPNNNESGTKLIVIEKVNLEVKKSNRYVVLEELIAEGQNPEEGTTFPQLVNRTSLRINTTYSTIIGRNESLVIHEFAIDVYEIISGGNHTFTKNVGLVTYYYQNPEDLILQPNSSKSEAIYIDSLELPTLGTYKFVFRVQFHIYQGDELPLDSYFAQNMTFELVKSYPTPPYIIIYAFYFVSILLIIFIILGLYGRRKWGALTD
ncbi:MAG: hypothetical protein ACFE95_15025 [Candidatus Hodarchaeota archaeon]